MFLQQLLFHKTGQWGICLNLLLVLKLQINQIEKVQRTAARWTWRRWWNTSSVGEMLDELECPSLEALPSFSFTRFIVEQCLLKRASVWPLLAGWKLPSHHITLNTADTRHTVMPWRIPFPQKTIPYWSSLSPSVANIQSTEEFRALV